MDDNRTLEEQNVVAFGEEATQTDCALDHQGAETLKLKVPIKMNGDLYEQLRYDFEELTAKDLHDVSKYLKQCGISVSVAALDFDYQLCVFHKAVKAKMPKVSLNDILRLKGADSMAATGLARNFLLDMDPGQRELGSLMESDE